MIDIASRPALGYEAPVQQQIESKWSQDESNPASLSPR